MKSTYDALMTTYTKDRFDLIFAIRNGEKTTEDFAEDVRNFCHQYYPQETDIENIIKELIQNLFGYSIITPLIDNKDITDIRILDWDHIQIKEKGIRKHSDIQFDSPEHYKRFIESVITRNQINASTINAITRFTDNTTSRDFILRFTLITSFLTTDEQYKLIIRKVPVNFMQMDDLVQAGMMTEKIKNYLEKRWEEGSLLVCGANSSGKTTLLNALKEKIPADCSVLVIQQAEELTSKNHPDMIFLHSVEGRGESEAKYDLRDLSVAGLTMDIDYFIIGEIKGSEANYMLNTAYTGHTCAATIHASSSETGIDKLIDYALWEGTYKKPELTQMMATCFKTVIFMKHFKVTQISEITGVYNGRIVYNTVYDEINGVDKINNE